MRVRREEGLGGKLRKEILGLSLVLSLSNPLSLHTSEVPLSIACKEEHTNIIHHTTLS